MRSITVKLGPKTYTIEIEKGLLDNIGERIKAITKASKVAIISDSNVAPLYADRLVKSLESSGFAAKKIIFPAGEKSKNFTVLGEVFNQLADFGLTRTDLLITLGGGVPGDLGGLAAATFLRGIDFIQVPTSLLAQIDSSVGGKVAIDLAAGKNLVGSFYQPKAVFIDPELLSTLPKRFLHDGLAEAIKYGCISDSRLFERIADFKDEAELLENIEEIIEVCCSIKAAIVERDEFDLGERMLLNYGHTIGHAIEKCSGFAKYTHGEGVAIGMAMLTQNTETMGLTVAGTTERLSRVLGKYALPSSAEININAILETIALDKKKTGSKITLVIIERIGQGKLHQIEYDNLPIYIGK